METTAGPVLAKAGVLVDQALADLNDEDAEVILCQALLARPTLCAGVADFAIQFLSTRVMTSRLTGTLNNYNEQNRYGFIACPAARIVFSHDVFVHKNELTSIIAVGSGVGTKVSFEIKIRWWRGTKGFLKKRS